jgi:Skp family chaperone for outer membrane proteins
VAVIDLDRVAQKLGQDRQITQAIQTQQSLLQKQLQELAAAYDQQLAQNRQNSAEPSTGEVALASWQQQASANLGKARQELEAKLTAHRAQLVLQFREQIKPFAREAARARGLSVIVTKNESVVYDFVDAVDISDDVVTAIRDSDAAQPLVSADVPQIARQPEAVQQR